MQASQYIQAIEDRQGLKISCPEEMAQIEIINDNQLKKLTLKYKNNNYGNYLKNLLH